MNALESSLKHRDEINKLLFQIRSLVEATITDQAKRPEDWRYEGDLQHVLSQLRAIVHYQES